MWTWWFPISRDCIYWPILTKLDIWVYINKYKVKFDNGPNPRILIRCSGLWLADGFGSLEAVFIDQFWRNVIQCIWVYIEKTNVKFNNGQNPHILIRCSGLWLADAFWSLEAVFIDQFWRTWIFRFILTRRSNSILGKICAYLLGFWTLIGWWFWDSKGCIYWLILTVEGISVGLQLLGE